MLWLLTTIALTQTIPPGRSVGTYSQPVVFRAYAASTGPLIHDDANTVAHVWWNGTSLQDTKGNSWAQNGTVPQVTSGPFYPTGFANAAKAGSGPFSDINYYSLGTGSDVLDFAGDFSICLVWIPAVADITEAGAGAVPISNGGYHTSGYYVQSGATISISLSNASTTTALNTSSSVANGPNVLCFGRGGSTWYGKANLGAIVTASSVPYVNPTNEPVYLGRYHDATGYPLNGNMRELWASSTPPSDALFTAIESNYLAQSGSYGQPITVTRSSTATDIPVGGANLYTWPPGTARADSSGFEVEPSATNVVLQSEAFDNIAWAMSSTTVTANSATAPDGTSTADTLQSTVSGGYIESTAWTAIASAYSSSVWVYTSAGTNSFDLAIWDSTAGAALKSCAGLTATTTKTRQTCLNSATATSGHSLKLRIYPGTSTGTGTVIAWGAQTETGVVATSYIPVSGTAATRNSDNVSVASTLKSGDSSRWCIKLVANSTDSGAWFTPSMDVWSLGAVGSANSATLTGAAFTVVDGSSGTKSISYAPASGSHTIVACDNAGTLSLRIDGSDQGAATGAGTGVITTVPGTLYWGSSNGSNPILGHISSPTVCRSGDWRQCR